MAAIIRMARLTKDIRDAEDAGDHEVNREGNNNRAGPGGSYRR
jgi:hypothetical protein